MILHEIFRVVLRFPRYAMFHVILRKNDYLWGSAVLTRCASNTFVSGIIKNRCDRKWKTKWRFKVIIYYSRQLTKKNDRLVSLHCPLKVRIAL